MIKETLDGVEFKLCNIKNVIISMKPGQRLGVICYENRYFWFGLIFFALKMQSCQKKSLSHNMAKQTLMSYVITWLNTLFNIGHWLLVNIGIL